MSSAVGAVSPFLVPLAILARAIGENDSDGALRALRQIVSLAEIHLSEND